MHITCGRLKSRNRRPQGGPGKGGGVGRRPRGGSGKKKGGGRGGGEGQRLAQQTWKTLELGGWATNWLLCGLSDFNWRSRRAVVVVTTLPAFRLTRRETIHDVFNLLSINSFVLHQRFSHRIELVAVFLQQALGGAVALINDAAYFLIDQFGGVGRDVALITAHATTKENFTLFFRVHQRTEFFRQPPLGDHVLGQ